MRPIHTQVKWALVSLMCAGSAIAETPAAKAAPASTTFTVNFNGGALEEYVALVKRQVSDANIVIDRVVGPPVKLPKASLPKVSLPLALQWVPNVTEARKRGLILQTTRGVD